MRTRRLHFRPFRAADETRLLDLWNRQEVRKYLWDDRPVSKERVREQIAWSHRSFARRGFGHFTLWLNEGERFAGFAGLRPFGEREEIEILCALAPDLWGRGLATEACRSLLAFAFQDLDLQEVFAGTDPPHTASLRLIERLGMSLARQTEVDGRPVRYYILTRAAFRSR